MKSKKTYSTHKRRRAIFTSERSRLAIRLAYHCLVNDCTIDLNTGEILPNDKI